MPTNPVDAIRERWGIVGNGPITQIGSYGDIATLLARVEALESRLNQIRVLVNDQAEDEALWATYLDECQPISEAYLQQELRKLHSTIEGVT